VDRYRCPCVSLVITKWFYLTPDIFNFRQFDYLIYLWSSGLFAVRRSVVKRIIFLDTRFCGANKTGKTYKTRKDWQMVLPGLFRLVY
jgi:hypothetical protein